MSRRETPLAAQNVEPRTGNSLMSARAADFANLGLAPGASVDAASSEVRVPLNTQPPPTLVHKGLWLAKHAKRQQGGKRERANGVTSIIKGKMNKQKEIEGWRGGKVRWKRKSAAKRKEHSY